MLKTVLQPLPLKATLALPATAPLHDRMVSLGMELNDQEGRPKWILFRQCYSDYFTKYIKPALNERKNVFIGGAQGIGKSVFTDILALLLVEDGEVVLLEHFDQRLLLIGNNPKAEAIAKVKQVLSNSMEYDPDSVSASQPGVYSIESDTVFRNLSTSEHLCVIQDLGSTQGRTVSFDGRSKKIWVSSPNADKLKPIRDDVQQLTLCVPPVSIKEMLEIRTKWNPHGYSEDQVRDRCSLYGGSVWFVLEMSESEATDAYDHAINEATRKSLHATFASTLLNLPKGSMSDVLLHAIPLHDDPERFRLRFASRMTSERLFNKFISTEQRASSVFLTMVRGAPELATFAGHVLEANMHDQICKGIKVKTKKLEKTAKAGPEGDATIPKLKMKPLFTAQDFSDIKLEDLVSNAYFRPTITNFPTIDSFAILPLSIFVPGAPGLCLVTFQSTVSKSHKTEGYVLVRLFNRVSQQLGKIRQFHVFLTGPNGIRTKQKVDMEKAEGGPYAPGHEPNIEQWAMTLGESIDKLFNLLEEAEQSVIAQA